MSDSESPQVPVKPEASANNEENSGTGDDETVSLKVSDSQTDVFFKVKRKTPLSKVMDAFCRRTGKDPKSLRFLFDGERVNGSDTPGSLGMEDGDKIEALNQQVGGACAPARN